jgi:hypothetical protein
MAHIEKQKRSGKYLIRWRTLAGERTSTTARTYDNAERLKRKIEDCLDLGRDWKPEVTGIEADIKEVADAYIDNRARRLRPRTLHRYAENMDLFIRFLRTRQREQPRALHRRLSVAPRGHRGAHPAHRHHDQRRAATPKGSAGGMTTTRPLGRNEETLGMRKQTRKEKNLWRRRESNPAERCRFRSVSIGFGRLSRR